MLKERKKLKSEDNAAPEISIVVPMFNEEENAVTLCERVFKTMDATGKKYELVIVDDGSSDKTSSILKDIYEKRKDVLKIITFNCNYGQYVAILAGFEHVKGDIIITLDADLQNLPEEIPLLLSKMYEGYDVVGSYRRKRHDSAFRTLASKCINKIREKTTGIKMKDHGCMLRAYRRSIVEKVIRTKETSTFITALAQRFATNAIDIPVTHVERSAGDSKYNLYKLIRITFDLLTGFSLAPLQILTMTGMFCTVFSSVYFSYEFLRKIISTADDYNLYFAIVFFLLSIVILGLGVLGEYIGRAYFAVCGHPSFVVRNVLEKDKERK